MTSKSMQYSRNMPISPLPNQMIHHIFSANIKRHRFNVIPFFYLSIPLNIGFITVSVFFVIPVRNGR
jgi:hypothetical protein